MPQAAFDEAGVRSAMRAYLDAADSLLAATQIGAAARDLLDAAETKTLAGMQLRKALEGAGWTAPSRQSTSTVT